MRVLFVSAEVFPFAKTGGLADVSAALPDALARQGIDIRILMPGYRQALERAQSPKEVLKLGDPLGWGETRILETYLPQSGVPVWLIDCPALYDRNGGLYADDGGHAWADNHLRYGLLSYVAAGIARELGASWRPDVVHANDWHTGLLPLLLRACRQRPSTVMTIHNLAYQGLFDASHSALLGLPEGGFYDMEFYGRISFLKAGLQSADALTTVSPSYAKEILTPEYGCGLDGVLLEKATQLSGILNGVDYSIWDPAIDPHLVHNYTTRSPAAKAPNKHAIQTEMGLEAAPDKPLIAFMSRLVHQKTPDIVLEALPALIEDGMQFALVAEGDPVYQDAFRRLAAAYPGRVAAEIGYREPLAHRLLAGADMLLHPSRFEPCGLVPIYALRYGTIPLVRKSGGMADSVVDASPEAVQQGIANGFSFAPPSVPALLECARRAHALYKQPIAWRKVLKCAMAQDFGWARSAEAYVELYRGLMRTRGAKDIDDNAMARFKGDEWNGTTVRGG